MVNESDKRVISIALKNSVNFLAACVWCDENLGPGFWRETGIHNCNINGSDNADIFIFYFNDAVSAILFKMAGF